jgi:hypothetical protein
MVNTITNYEIYQDFYHMIYIILQLLQLSKPSSYLFILYLRSLFAKPKNLILDTFRGRGRVSPLNTLPPGPLFPNKYKILLKVSKFVEIFHRCVLFVSPVQFYSWNMIKFNWNISVVDIAFSNSNSAIHVVMLPHLLICL